MLKVIIGIEKSVLNKCKINEWVGINSTICQTIRWKRKPIWLPPVKSKLFRVRPRLRLDPSEADEIIRIYNNYRTQCKAVKNYLELKYEANQVQFDEEVLKKAEEEDFEISMKINDEWNKKVAVTREERVKKEFEKRQLQTLENFENRKLRMKEVAELFDQKISQAKIDSATFITRDNIDKAIEEALANIKSYNTAIDIDGNIHTKYFHEQQTEAIKQ